MSTLYITEFSQLGGADKLFSKYLATPQIAMTPPVVEQAPITISGSSAPSAAFGPTTTYVRIESDVVCSIAWGVNPTATTSNMRLAANAVEYFGVVPGQKLAVIANT